MSTITARLTNSRIIANNQQENSMAQQFVAALGQTGATAVVNGGVGAGIDYFIFKNRGSDILFGVELPSWAIAFLEGAGESFAADWIGARLIPYLEGMMTSNDTVKRITRVSLPPVLAGGAHVAIERYYYGNRDSMMKQFGMAAVQKLAVDALMKNWFFPQ